ncbi:MAG TPA: RNA polymerase sigma-70 factor [Chitinophagaceae bacterium]
MDNSSSKNERHFSQPFKDGQEKAFDFFFRQFYAPLCLFAEKYVEDPAVAKDMVQECFTRLWQRRTSINKPESIKSFLYTAVRNQCLTWLTHEKSLAANHRKAQSLAPVSEENILAAITEAEALREIYQAIGLLPPKMQLVFRKFYLEGKTYQEIADELQLSLQTVRNQKSDALAWMKRKLAYQTILWFFLFYN